MTWPSREQKLTRLDVLLIFVFVWSLAICLFPIVRAGLWLGKEEEQGAVPLGAKEQRTCPEFLHDLEFALGLSEVLFCPLAFLLCQVTSLCLWILYLKANPTQEQEEEEYCPETKYSALPGKKEKEETV